MIDSRIQKLEETIAAAHGVSYAVAVADGTDAMRRMLALALIDDPSGKNFMCPDLVSESAAQVLESAGVKPVLIDVTDTDWCMDPELLEEAFRRFPEAKYVLFSHIYGYPGRISEVKRVCASHGATLFEDATEALGAELFGKKVGSIGDVGILDFSAETGISGGMLLTNDRALAEKARGFDIRMDGNAAERILTEWERLPERIAKRTELAATYQEEFEDEMLLLRQASEGAKPSYSYIGAVVDGGISLVDEPDPDFTIHGAASPKDILGALASAGYEGHAVRKPLHARENFSDCTRITRDDLDAEKSAGGLFLPADESGYLYKNAILLPSDVTMNAEAQEEVIDLIYECFDAGTSALCAALTD